MGTIFISYTHDSSEHSKRVLGLANDLRRAGFDADLDQYHANQDWPAWMERSIERAEFVIVVCTPVFLRRWNNDEKPGVGLGAQWESMLTRQHLYVAPGRNEKFVPVIFESRHTESIPTPLGNVTRVDLSRGDGFDRLRCRLLRIPPSAKPPLRTSLAPFALAGGFFSDHSAVGAEENASVTEFGMSNEPEKLYPNLFPVTFASEIQTAQLTIRRGIKPLEYFDQIWGHLDSRAPHPKDFWLEDRTLYTFRPFTDLHLSELVRLKAIRPGPCLTTVSMAESRNFGTKNRFIKLLNRCLDHICVTSDLPHKIEWSRDMRCHLFVRDGAKSEGRLKVKAIAKDGTRVVFRAVLNKFAEDQTTVQHWQHQAFRHFFVRFGAQWFLNVIPFWAFTSNGHTAPSRWQKSSSRNMRKPERNRAVLGHVMFWAAILCREPDLVRPAESFRIHRPPCLNVSPSICDEEWIKISKPDERVIAYEDLNLAL